MMVVSKRSRIPKEEWESHKTRIQRLYLEEDRRLEGKDGVMDIMLHKYHFSASKSQFETKFQQWAFGKYSKKVDWQILAHVIAARKVEGKLTNVYLYGECVKPSKIRKETTRHRHGSTIKGDLKGLARSLPHYMEFRTPKMTHASISSNCKLNSSVLMSQGETPDHEVSSTDLVCVQRDVTIAEPTLSNRDLTNWFLVEHSESLIPPYTAPLHGNTHSYVTVSDHIFNELDPSSSRYQRTITPKVAAVFNIADLDFPMASLVMLKSSLQHSLHFLGEKDSTAFQRVTRMFRSSTGCVYRDMETGKTGKLLRELPMDLAVVYRILFLLINNLEVLDRLHNDNPGDIAFRTGIRYLHSLPRHMLNRFLDTVPQTFSYAVEQNFFCTAVECGATGSVKSILERRLLDMGRVICEISGVRYTPLERAVELGHIEVIRTLVVFGADPNMGFKRSPLIAWSQLQSSLDCVRLEEIDNQEGEHGTQEEIDAHDNGHSARTPRDRGKSKAYVTTSADTLEIFTILLKAGARLNENIFHGQSFSAKTIQFMLSNVGKPKDDFFVKSSFLEPIISNATFDDDDDVCSLATSILSIDYKDSPLALHAFMTHLNRALSAAILRGNAAIIGTLLSAGATPDATSLLHVVETECLPLITRFLDLGVSANCIISRGEFSTEKTTPLAEAIRGNHLEALELFKSRSYFDSMHQDQASLILARQAACSRGNLEFMDLLLPKLSLNQQLDFSDTFIEAIQNGHLEVTKTLIKFGIHPGPPALAVAIEQRNPNLCELLIENVVNLHTDRESLLFKAILWGDVGIVKHLVQAGVCTYQPGYLAFELEDYHPLVSRGESILVGPLAAAILTGRGELTNLILNVDTPYSGLFLYQISPLAAAIIMRDSNLVRDLIQRGQDPLDNWAIAIASHSQNLALTRYLFGQIQKRYPKGWPGFGTKALLEAIRGENLLMLSELSQLTDGSRFIFEQRTTTNDDVMTPLGAAISSNSSRYMEMIRILLESGRDPNAVVFMHEVRNEVRTAVLHAISMRRQAVIELLSAYGAKLDLSPQGKVTCTPLQHAANLGFLEIVAYLLEYVDPNERPATPDGGTALQFAARKGHYSIATLLLQRGADINASAGTAVLGMTAFEGAAKYGRLDMMLLLSRHGVDLLSNNERQYKRALKFSRYSGQLGAMKLVEEMYKAAIKERETASPLLSGEGMEGLVHESVTFGGWPVHGAGDSLPENPFSDTFA